MTLSRAQTLGIWAGVTTLLCGVVVGWLHCHGTAARSTAASASDDSGPRPLLALDARELYTIWTNAGVHGRILVHHSRFLHFTAVPHDAALVDNARFPVRTFDLIEHSEQQLSPRNVLWVAMQRGIARQIVHLLSPAELGRRIASLPPDAPGIDVVGDAIVTSEHGSPRLITATIGVFEEPVLVSIDASALADDEDIDRVLAVVARLRPRADVLVLCRSNDNPDVVGAERRRLDELARRLGASRP